MDETSAVILCVFTGIGLLALFRPDKAISNFFKNNGEKILGYVFLIIIILGFLAMCISHDPHLKYQQ